MDTMSTHRHWGAARVFAALAFLALIGPAGSAQVLSVQPVNIFLSPGQRATTLSVANQGSSETSIQIRAFDWKQKDGEDQLTATNDVVVSPPLCTIPAGAAQIIRIVLRQSPQGQEGTYRILVDQVPPPAEAGVVHVVLRLSIPIFAQPKARALAQVKFHVESKDNQVFLVGVNEGQSHEAIRDIVLATSDGRTMKVVSGVSPYILAGATRRWPMDAKGYLPKQGEALDLTAHAAAGDIKRQVSVVAAP